MADKNNPIEGTLKNVEAAVAKQPWYVWAGALTGGGLVFWYVIKSRAAAATTTATTNTPATSQNSPLNGYDVSSMAGIPYGYDPTSGPVDNYPPPSTTPPPATTPPTQQGLVRIRANVPGTAGYDKNNAQGVPIRATAGGNVTRYATFGSDVQLAGLPVTGPGNLPGGKGSTIWFPILGGGYISAYDITSIFTGNPPSSTGTGNGGVSGEWQDGMNKHRRTIDQHAVASGLMGGDA